MYCQECGCNMMDEAKFCPDCGARQSFERKGTTTAVKEPEPAYQVDNSTPLLVVCNG